MTNTNKENKNVNKVNNVKENKGDNTMNMNAVTTKDTNRDIAVEAINSALTVGTNSTTTFRNAVTTLKKCDYNTSQAVNSLFNANTLRADKLKLERAKLYAGLKGNPDILAELKCKNVSEFVDKYELGDKKATVSESIKVYNIFYDTGVKELKTFVHESECSFTELVELTKVFQGAKTDEEKTKELINFIHSYAPHNTPSWNTCKELRDKIYIYVHGVEPAPKTDKADNTDKADKADSADKGNADYNSIKSVDETSTKDANSTIKALKDKGDYTENKVKGTITITANSVSDFMTALVALAKKQGVKPLSFTGDIVFTISGHK